MRLQYKSPLPLPQFRLYVFHGVFLYFSFAWASLAAVHSLALSRLCVAFLSLCRLLIKKKITNLTLFQLEEEMTSFKKKKKKKRPLFSSIAKGSDTPQAGHRGQLQAG